MDIRNFFGANSRKKSSSENEEIVLKKKSSRSKGVLFDSDSSDEESIITKKVKKEILKTPAKTRKSPRKKVANTPTLSKTTPSDFFGSTPVKPKIMKRKSSADKHESKPKISKRECIDVTDDDLDAFEITPQPKKSPPEPMSKKLSKLMNKKNDAEVKREKPKPLSTDASKKNGVNKKETSCDASNIIPATPPTKLSSRPNKELENGSESAKKEKFLKYQQWQNRSGPAAPGSKEVPKGADNCFEGLTFVITGVQESLTRDEIKSLVERYSGKVTTSVSSRTKYLITGEDAGESKLKKAAQHKTKIIDEDEFLDLIRTLPAKKSKYSINEEIITKPASKIKEISPKKIKSELDINKNSKTVPKGKISTEMTSKISPKKIKSEVTISSMESPKVNSQDFSQGSPSKNGLMWVDKYKPVTIKQIIGQQGPSSNVNKLLAWLKRWHFNNRSIKGKAKPKPKMNQWGGGDPTGAGSKAALLSGPPGVGKTTTATLVCKELGYEYVELNASDTRSKRTLKEDVAASVENTTIGNMFGKKSSKTGVQNVLIMDEVDGMAGNEDRGGMSELIQIIKATKIPIICMCNDRSSPKMKSLTNHCFDLRFQRPRVEQITGSVMSICFKEGLKVQAPSVQSIIRGCNQDVRQVLHNLNMIRSNQGSLDYDAAQSHSKQAFKDVNMGIFDVAHKLLSSESASMSINEKSNLFFMDYSMMPKFVQDNYVMMNPIAAKGNAQKRLDLLSKTADDIAVGDFIETALRRSQAWSLLPTLGLVSTVIPCDVMRGGLQGRINFPSFFGKLSKTTKSSRILQELKFHSSLATSGSSERTFNLDVLPYLRWHLTEPLIEQTRTGNQELQRSMKLLSDYDFLREDFDSIAELGQYPGFVNPITKIDSKVKTQFTRAYNKEGHLIPYSMMSNASAKKGKVSTGLEEYDQQEKESQEDESEDDGNNLDTDKMIKQKKKPAAKKAKPAAAKKEKIAPTKKKRK